MTMPASGPNSRFSDIPDGTRFAGSHAATFGYGGDS